MTATGITKAPPESAPAAVTPEVPRGAVAYSLLTSGGVLAVNILTGVILARSLGPSGRGELAALLLWPSMLVLVGSLGVGDGITYHGARGTAPVGTLVGSTLAISVAQSVVLVGIGALIIPLVFADYGGSTLVVAYVLLAYIPASLLAHNLMWVLTGLQRFGWFQWLRFSVILATAVVLVGLRLADSLDVTSAAITYLAVTMVALIATAVPVARMRRSALRPSFSLVRQLLAFGIRSQLSNVSSVLNERLDQLLISIFLAPARLGLYVIAVTLTSATGLVGTSVAVVALPVVAKHQPGHRRTEAARRFVGATILASALLTLPLLVFTPSLIGLFFGPDFVSAANVSRVLLVAAIAFSTSRALGSVLKAIGRPLDPGLAELFALAATVIGLATLLPALGLMGAALASLVAYGVSTWWMVRLTSRALGLSPTRLLLLDRRDIHDFTRRARTLLGPWQRRPEGARS
jgi:O-antigen/teichoic acid export membrane protein